MISLEKLQELDKESAEEILQACEDGLLPPNRYLPYLLEGFHDISEVLVDEIQKLRNRQKALSVVFPTSERGGGKTSLSLALRNIFQSETKGYNVPVTLDLALHKNAVSFIKKLYFKMLFGVFQIPETETEDQE